MLKPLRARTQPLLRLAQAFPRRRVLVVGDLVADHYIYGHTDRVSREAPVLVVRYERAEVKLGGGANAAANARSLGGQVTALGAVGKDEMGRELRRQFRAAGIRLLASCDGSLETESKTRVLAGGVNTSRQQVLRLDRGPHGPLSPHMRLELARAVKVAARQADAIVVSDYGAGVLSPEVRVALQQLAREGLPVCVDSRYHLREFTDVTVCKPNEPELEVLTGMSVRTESDLLAAGRRALEVLGCRALVVTRGRQGMAVFEGDDVQLIPACPGEAVDVTGAGDTVVAAFTLALAAGAAVIDAARIANVAGGLVVRKPGTATVERAELLTALETEP